jgi:glycosyltransferase involved in cell wall biosynthesis
VTVLHVIPFLWSGAGHAVVRLCEAQRAAGLRVHVVTSGSSRGQRDWPTYRRALARAGVTWHRAETFDRQPDAFWPATVSLAELMADVRPALVHAHAGVPAAAVAVARARAGRRVAVVAQMYSWGPNRPTWMDQMDLWGFRQADAVIWSARAYRTRLVQGGVAPTRLHMVRLGIDPPARVRLAPMLIDPAGGRIGFVGRLEPRKQQHVLVQVVDQLRKTRPGITLDLIGPVADQAYADGIVRDIEARNLQAHVRMTGKVRDVWQALAGCDLFVSLSSDEGQGLAVLEAMAARVPVVALPVAGVEDYLLDRRTGLALQRDDPAHVARVIARALERPDDLSTMVRHAAAMVGRRYRWDATLARVTQVYADARAVSRKGLR